MHDKITQAKWNSRLLITAVAYLLELVVLYCLTWNYMRNMIQNNVVGSFIKVFLSVDTNHLMSHGSGKPTQNWQVQAHSKHEMKHVGLSPVDAINCVK